MDAVLVIVDVDLKYMFIFLNLMWALYELKCLSLKYWKVM